MGKKKQAKSERKCTSRLETLIDDEFRNTVHMVRNIVDKFNAVRTYDLSGVLLKRRKQAARAEIEKIQEHYKTRWANLDLEAEWARFCSAPSMSPTQIETQEFFSTAAAIWILDELENCGRKSEAIYYLPEKGTEETEIPFSLDSRHDICLIQRMVWLIKERDGEKYHQQCWLNEITALRREAEHWSLPEEHTEPDQFSNRERFNAIMHMIPADRVTHSKRQFLQKADELTDLYFTCIDRYRQREKPYREALTQTLTECRQFCQATGAGWPFDDWELDWPPEIFGLSSDISLDISLPKINPLKPIQVTAMSKTPRLPLSMMPGTISKMMPKTSQLLSSPTSGSVNSGSPGDAGEFQRFSLLTRKALAEQYALSDIQEKRISLLLSFYILPALSGDSLKNWRKNQDEDIAQLVRGFHIDNPYEICFAYLALIEENSQIPWIYTLSATILSAAAIRLPWWVYPERKEQESEEQDHTEDTAKSSETVETENTQEKDMENTENINIEDTEKESSEDAETDEEMQDSLPEWSEEWENEILYAPTVSQRISNEITPGVEEEQREKKTETEEEKRAVSHWNRSQMIHELSNGLIGPRKLYTGDLSAYHLPAEEELVWRYCIQLARDVKKLLFQHQTEQKFALEWEDDEENTLEQDIQELPEGHNPEDLERRNQELESRLSAMRKELYAANRRIKEYQTEVQRIRKDVANELQELRDLRELVFNMDTKDDEPHGKLYTPNQEEEIQFPCEVTHRTMVFGGHDTWLKAIRPMLPNVTFVGKDVRPVAEAIRRADVIWIQHNALGHKYYYRIIDLVRINRIPVRYFSFASAEKCALQLVAADRELV